MHLQNLSKSIISSDGYERKLFENLSFDIVDNGITSIIAQKDIEKRSLIKILAGLDENYISKKLSGAIIIPSLPSSYPWLNVKENIMFGKEIIEDDLLKSILHLTGLEGYESHFPVNKSVGFRFRISLARSIACNPEIILLDEPFQIMNENLKNDIYQLILDVNDKLNITFLLTTLNVSEAVLLSDKIHLFSNNQMELIESFVCKHENKNLNSRLNSDELISKIKTVEESINQYRKKTSQVFF